MKDGLRIVGAVIFLRFAGMHPRLARWLGWTDELVVGQFESSAAALLTPP